MIAAHIGPVPVEEILPPLLLWGGGLAVLAWGRLRRLVSKLRLDR